MDKAGGTPSFKKRKKSQHSKTKNRNRLRRRRAEGKKAYTFKHPPLSQIIGSSPLDYNCVEKAPRAINTPHYKDLRDYAKAARKGPSKAKAVDAKVLGQIDFIIKTIIFASKNVKRRIEILPSLPLGVQPFQLPEDVLDKCRTKFHEAYDSNTTTNLFPSESTIESFISFVFNFIPSEYHDMSTAKRILNLYACVRHPESPFKVTHYQPKRLFRGVQPRHPRRMKGKSVPRQLQLTSRRTIFPGTSIDILYGIASDTCEINPKYAGSVVNPDPEKKGRKIPDRILVGPLSLLNSSCRDANCHMGAFHGDDCNNTVGAKSSPNHIIHPADKMQLYYARTYFHKKECLCDLCVLLRRMRTRCPRKKKRLRKHKSKEWKLAKRIARLYRKTKATKTGKQTVSKISSL